MNLILQYSFRVKFMVKFQVELVKTVRIYDILVAKVTAAI
jgi:hypothetical protein